MVHQIEGWLDGRFTTLKILILNLILNLIPTLILILTQTLALPKDNPKSNLKPYSESNPNPNPYSNPKQMLMDLQGTFDLMGIPRCINIMHLKVFQLSMCLTVYVWLPFIWSKQNNLFVLQYSHFLGDSNKIVELTMPPTHTLPAPITFNYCSCSWPIINCHMYIFTSKLIAQKLLLLNCIVVAHNLKGPNLNPSVFWNGMRIKWLADVSKELDRN